MWLRDTDQTHLGPARRVAIAAILSLLFVVAFAALMFASTELLRYGGAGTLRWPHLQWRGYTAGDVRATAASVGPSAWSWYGVTLWIDFAAALLFGVLTLYSLALMAALSGVGARKIGGWRTASIPVTTIAAVALIADLLENALLLMVVSGVESDAGAPSATLAAIASSATQIKLGAYAAALVVLAYLTFDFVFGLSDRRGDAIREHASR